MQRDILITDLTAMQKDRVCIAGVSRDWAPARPVFARASPARSHLCRDGQVLIRPRAVLSLHLEPFARPAAPHVEDCLWSQPRTARFLQLLEDERWRRVLQRLADACPRPLFGAGLQRLGNERNRVLRPGPAACSLATLRCAGPVTFHFILKSSAPDKFRYALHFSDDHGASYENIPVTDLALRACARASFLEGASAPAVSESLTAQLNAADSLFLRVGLGRRYKGRYWLQVNGIYSFPDFLQGRCFADFPAPQR